MTTGPPTLASGRANSSALRNWLETSPRTRIGLPMAKSAAGQAMQRQRRETGLAEFVDAAAELAQCIDQITDRPLVHARYAVQLETSTLRGGEHGQCGGQRPHRGTGIAEEQPGLLHREPAGQALHVHRGAVARDVTAELGQRSHHDARVVGVEQVVNLGRALGQGRPAAGRGWRCSWSPAVAPCRRRRRTGAGRETVSRTRPAGSARGRRLGAASVHLPAGARIGGLAQQVFERFDVARANDMFQRVERVAKA